MLSLVWHVQYHLFSILSGIITVNCASLSLQTVYDKEDWDTRPYLSSFEIFLSVCVSLCCEERQRQMFPLLFWSMSGCCGVPDKPSSLLWGVSPHGQAHRLPYRACLHTQPQIESKGGLISMSPALTQLLKYAVYIISSAFIFLVTAYVGLKLTCLAVCLYLCWNACFCWMQKGAAWFWCSSERGK